MDVNVKTMFTIDGKDYNSIEEAIERIKNDPESNVLIWDYQINEDVVNGVPVGGAKGKCHWKGKTYEGEIEHRGNKLYVGGEFVKEEL